MVLMVVGVGVMVRVVVIRHSELVVLDLKLLHDGGRRGRRPRELWWEWGRRRRGRRPGGVLKGAARARRRGRPAAAIHGREGEVNVGGPLVHRSL